MILVIYKPLKIVESVNPNQIIVINLDKIICNDSIASLEWNV